MKLKIRILKHNGGKLKKIKSFYFKILLKLVLLPIQVYQIFISPLIGHNCRFLPTCSDYATESINRFGIFKGFLLTIRRLLRCHPFSKSSYDPVPKK